MSLVALSATAPAYQLHPVGSSETLRFRQSAASTDAQFVMSMLQDARTQRALARLAQERESAASLAPLAGEAAAIWLDAEEQLEVISNELHIVARPADAGIPMQEIAQLRRAGAATFNAVYIQSIARTNSATLSRLESLDAKVNPRITFFADRFLPRFITLQNQVQAQLLR